MTITINVPDGEMADEVGSWVDGQTYTPTIKQTGEGQFDMVSTDSDTDSMEDEPVTEEATEPPAKPGKLKHRNPAIALILK